MLFNCIREHHLIYGSSYSHFCKEIRAVAGSEYPLGLQLNHGPHQSAMELRLVQVRESRSSVPMASGRRKSKVRGGNDSSESGSDESPNIMPKEEGRVHWCNMDYFIIIIECNMYLFFYKLTVGD